MQRVSEVTGRAERSASPSLSMCWRAALALRRVFFLAACPRDFAPAHVAAADSDVLVDSVVVLPGLDSNQQPSGLNGHAGKAGMASYGIASDALGRMLCQLSYRDRSV
jgi:hypothetical protein